MSLRFQVERWPDVRQEGEDLFQLHWEEIALWKDHIKLAPDYEMYAEIEKRGLLQVITARDGAQLVGYYIGFVHRHEHYKNDLICITDVFFLHKDHRKGLAGYRFWKFIEREIQKLGVKKIVAGTKLHKDLGRLFERLGWVATDRMYGKYLGEETTCKEVIPE